MCELGVHSSIPGNTEAATQSTARNRLQGSRSVALAITILATSAGHIRDGFDPWVGKIPWRRAWQPTPVFLSGEFHGQRSLGATVYRVAKSQTRLK